MKIKETRYMNSSDLRKLCIEHDWFTRADNEAYSKFLNMTRKRTGESAPMTANRLLDMALVVQQYSDPETYEGMDLEGIVFSLCEICYSCFRIEY